MRAPATAAPTTSGQRIYWAAEDHNYDLDYDLDRVACGKH